jgi:hypothetical protein
MSSLGQETYSQYHLATHFDQKLVSIIRKPCTNSYNIISFSIRGVGGGEKRKEPSLKGTFTIPAKILSI